MLSLFFFKAFYHVLIFEFFLINITLVLIAHMFLIIYGFTSKRMIEEAMKGSHLHPRGTPVNARKCAETKGISRSHQLEQSWQRDWFKLVWNFKYLPLTPSARTFILHPQVWTEYKCLPPRKNEYQPPSIAKDGGQVPLRKNEVDENLVHNTPSQETMKFFLRKQINQEK